MNLTRNRLLLIVGVPLTIVLVGGIIVYAGSGPKQQPLREQPLPAASQQQLEYTDLAKVEKQLGPFEPIAVSADAASPDTKAPSILLLEQTGRTKASQRTKIEFDPADWSQGSVNNIRSVSVDHGFATIGTDFDRIFKVKCGQVFIFASRPDMAYVVDDNTVIWSATTARVIASVKPRK